MDDMVRIARLERKLLDYLETAELALFDAIETAKANDYTDEFVQELEQLRENIEIKSTIIKNELGAAERIAVETMRKEHE